MTLHVKDGGTWKQAQEVFVKDGGTWKACNDVLIKDAGTWKSAMYQTGSQNYTTNGTFSFTVPAGVYSITSIVIGGGGGGGGCTGYGDNHAGGGGGSGGINSSSISVTPGETITVVVGKYGAGASTFFNSPVYTNPENSSYTGLTGGTSSVSRSSTVLLQATGGNGGTYSDGDACIASSGAGGSPSGVAGGSIDCNRNSYPATQGGQLSGYTYGKGGNSHNNSNFTPTNGNNGAVLLSW